MVCKKFQNTISLNFKVKFSLIILDNSISLKFPYTTFYEEMLNFHTPIYITFIYMNSNYVFDKTFMEIKIV